MMLAVAESRLNLVIDQADRGVDPTGTAMIRRSFRAEAARRLSQLRSMTYTQLVERDFMAHREDPLRQLFPQSPADPGERLASFYAWFRSAAAHAFGGEWARRHLAKAWRSGEEDGSALVASTAFTSVPATYALSARAELDGISSALLQQVTRQIAAGARSRTKPAMLYRHVLASLRKTGTVRLNTWVNSAVVQLHNAGRLSAFRQAGVTAVGVIPELIPVPVRHDHLTVDAPFRRKSAYHSEEGGEEEYVNVKTAMDNKVCDDCEEISDTGPYSLDEAEDLLPVHPNCRCVLIPAFDLRFTRNRQLILGEGEEEEEE